MVNEKFSRDADVFARIANSATDSWETIGNSIVSLEHEAFGDASFATEELKADFFDSNTTWALLFNGEDIVGFSYAKRSEDFEAQPVAFIWDTVIAKPYRHKGLVGVLMNVLEVELKKAGYIYIEREAAVSSGYAERISKHYHGRIVEEGEPHDSKWGQQKFFRIRL